MSLNSKTLQNIFQWNGQICGFYSVIRQFPNIIPTSEVFYPNAVVRFNSRLKVDMMKFSCGKNTHAEKEKNKIATVQSNEHWIVDTMIHSTLRWPHSSFNLNQRNAIKRKLCSSHHKFAQINFQLCCLSCGSKTSSIRQIPDAFAQLSSTNWIKTTNGGKFNMK